MKAVWMEEVGCDISSHPPIVSRSGPYSILEEGAPWGWWDFSRLALADGDPISSATDFSGNARHATQSGTARPTFRTAIRNGLGVARFDGSNDWLDLPSTFSGSSYTLFVVLMESATPTGGRVRGLGQLSGQGYQGAANTTTLFHSDNTIRSITVATAIDTWYYDAVQRNGSTSLNMYRNGSSTAVTPLSGSVGYLALGAHRNPSAFWNGDIGEVIAYNSYLTDAAVARINNYLAKKWGF